jgi:predicted nucleic acid-binding protein
MLAVKSDVFLDTSHLIALASTRDAYHAKSVELAEATAAAGRTSGHDTGRPFGSW